MYRTINRYTLLREKSTGRIGTIMAFRLDLKPRAVAILVRFEGHANAVSFTGLDNIIDSFEVIRRVNGQIRTLAMDEADVLLQSDDLNDTRTAEKMRIVHGE